MTPWGSYSGGKSTPACDSVCHLGSLSPVGDFLRAAGLGALLRFLILGRAAEEGPPPPSLYDIAGSATWFNRCDIGLVVHRPPGKHTEIHLRKSRDDQWGEKGGMALAEYEKWSGRFLTPHSELFKEGDQR